MGYLRAAGAYGSAKAITAHKGLRGAAGLAGMQTAYGAMAGGLYGAASSDTSVLGGMAAGAALGRYGGAGLRGGLRGYRTGSMGAPAMGPLRGRDRMMSAIGRGGARAFGQARADFRWLMSNGRASAGQLGATLRGNAPVAKAATPVAKAAKAAYQQPASSRKVPLQIGPRGDPGMVGAAFERTNTGLAQRIAYARAEEQVGRARKMNR